MKIATIGNVDHTKTTLTETILKIIKDMGNDIIVIDDEKERGLTINESIKQDNAMMITALKEYGGIEEIIKSGRENRRERRKRERNSKK